MPAIKPASRLTVFSGICGSVRASSSRSSSARSRANASSGPQGCVFISSFQVADPDGLLRRSERKENKQFAAASTILCVRGDKSDRFAFLALKFNDKSRPANPCTRVRFPVRPPSRQTNKRRGTRDPRLFRLYRPLNDQLIGAVTQPIRPAAPRPATPAAMKIAARTFRFRKYRMFIARPHTNENDGRHSFGRRARCTKP